MLQKLRDQTQNTGFKILIGAIIVVLTLFGFGATNIFMGTDPEIAEVGDFSITQNVLAMETERERMRILNRMGPDFDPTTIDRQQLSEYVVQQLINKQIVYQATADLGIQIPEAKVNEELIAAPAYQVDGQFNEAVYRQSLQTLGYSPVDFLVEYRSALSAELLQAGVTESLAMTDWELGELVRVINQTRDLAYLPLSVAAYSDDLEATDDEVALRYEEEQSSYMTDLALDVEYVSLNVDTLVADLADDPRLSVNEEELRAQYEDEKSAALRDEQRDSSHILVNVNDDRDEAEALARIEETAARLQAGEDFAALAEEISDDPGSAKAGGALGAIGKGIFDPAFEDALWALPEPGAVSEPVRSTFGYHIIRLEQIVEKDYPSFESEQAALTATVRRIKAMDVFAEMARDLEEFSYDEQTSLNQTAEELGLEITTVAGLTRVTTDPKLSTPSLLEAAFSETVLAGDNSSAIALGEEEMVVLRVAQEYPPELKPLEAVADEIRNTIVEEKALQLIEENRAEGLAMLEAGDSAADVARALSSDWQSFEAVGRSPRNAQDALLPTEVRTFAFGLPRPPAGEKSVGAVATADGAALVTVTRVVQGDLDATLDAEAEQLRIAAQQRGARLDFQSLVQAAERELGVDRPSVQNES